MKTPNLVTELRSPTRAVMVFLSLALLFVITGCLSRPALVHQTFALQSPPASGAATVKGDSVLLLRTFEVSPLFRDRSLVYRTGPDSYELDPYAGFLVPPARALDIPLAAYLQNSGAFKDVVEPGSPFAADTMLDIQVGELYGDFRQSGQPAAVLSLRLLMFRNVKGGEPVLLLQKNYSRSIALPQKTAAAVVAGWDKALAEIMAEAITDIATALDANPPALK